MGGDLRALPVFQLELRQGIAAVCSMLDVSARVPLFGLVEGSLYLAGSGLGSRFQLRTLGRRKRHIVRGSPCMPQLATSFRSTSAGRVSCPRISDMQGPAGVSSEQT